MKHKDNVTSYLVKEDVLFKMKWLFNTIQYYHLENNPKKICMLNGSKLCFYNLIETQNIFSIF